MPALIEPEVRALLVCVLPLLLVLQLPAQLEPEVRALLMPVLLLRVPQLPALLYQHLRKGEVTCAFARESALPVTAQ